MSASRPSAAPRRWSEAVEGIRWLPRMIDKARMRHEGTLGAYLLGNSPVDRALMRRLDITTEQFAALVAVQPDDRAVLEALRQRGFDETKVRRWSERFERTYGLLIHLWDVDEGHVAPNAVERAGLALWRPIERAVISLARRLLPAP
jgi:hypothetical protein